MQLSNAQSFLRGLFGPKRESHNKIAAVNSSIPNRPITVGIVGTFDVENYGDLLFPLMAQAAFAQRSQSIQVLPISPNRRSRPAWPFEVCSIEDLPELLPTLSALLIGGGQLIRYDKGYPVPAGLAANLPIGYWLIPAALGALIGKPVFWNAIGAWTDSPPAPWFDDLVNTVLAASHFVGVRDAASRNHLAIVAPGVDIRVIPDTVFSISRFWPLERPSTAYLEWRQSLGVQDTYAVVQADRAIGAHRHSVEALLAIVGASTAVALPICWCHGDRTESFPLLGGNVIASPNWLDPRLTAEIIGRAELVIASSLHACITALSYGVPCVRVPSFNAADRKFELLDQFEGVVGIDNWEQLAWHRSGREGPRVVTCADKLDGYWDQVTDVVLQPHLHNRKLSMALMLAWAPQLFVAMEAAAHAQKKGSHAEYLQN